MVTVLALSGCGSSKKREASIAEMKRVQSAFGDLQIAVDAGVSQQEFSQRVNDMLVKIGDFRNSENLALLGLPKEQNKVQDIYAHFSRAAEAYKLSKEFFGDRWDPVGEEATDFPSEEERETVKTAFPDVFPSYGVTSRRDTLRDLWKLASDETRSAKTLMDQLDSSSGN